MERPLALHESALSEPEYQAYTCILHEIAPDTAGSEWEAVQVPMGEAKGWIRGKYAVDAALLEQILRLFPATAFQGSTIKGPQLLAILRLISHAQAGRGVDRSLVFTQATKPLGADIQSPNVVPLSSPLPPPPPRSSPYPNKPPPPVRQGSTSAHPPPPDAPGGRRISSEDTASRTSLSSNPFRRSLSQNPNANIGGPGSSYARSTSAVADDESGSDAGRRSPTYSAPAITRTSRPPSVTRASSSRRGGATPDESPFSSNNPFFRPPDSTAVTLPVAVPPLPPRKPPSQSTSTSTTPAPSHIPIQPPPRHPAPPPPPKPVRKTSHTHSPSTSNLIRQSLIAAKTAPKAPEGTLASAMKSLVIVKSSSSGHPSTSSTGTLKDRVRGEKEKSSDSSAATTTAFSQSGRSVGTSTSTPSSSASASSIEFVASARPPPPKPLIRSTTTTVSTPHSRSVSPSKLSPTKLSMAEAQDVVQISASSSSSTDLGTGGGAAINRPTRSKSLHGTASSSSMKGPVPTPPPRRRPESVQVTGSPFISTPTSAPSSGGSPFSLSRRSSVQNNHPSRPTHSPSPSRSVSTSARANTPPAFKDDPFSSFYSTVKQHLVPNSAAVTSNHGAGPTATTKPTVDATTIFQPAAAELHKIGTKLEGGLAPGRGYISHRGAEGERLVSKKGTEDDEDDDDDGYRRLSAYSDAPTVDSDTPGMDVNPSTEEWMNWDPTPGPRPVLLSRGGSDATLKGYSSSSGQQRRDVQKELDRLRAQKVGGWGRMI
ncbi:hypothetical protein FRB90_006807 [Tulasnella sp. 427]|nr:hypothetical protein FRB90_006807 [Tulasnella sp. 427]